ALGDVDALEAEQVAVVRVHQLLADADHAVVGVAVGQVAPHVGVVAGRAHQVRVPDGHHVGQVVDLAAGEDHALVQEGRDRLVGDGGHGRIEGFFPDPRREPPGAVRGGGEVAAPGTAD